MAERATLESRIYGNIRRRDNPDIGCQRSYRSNGPILTFLQEPKNLHLGKLRKRIHFIKKQRPAVCLVYQATFCGYCAGECSLFMSEELALNEFGGNGPTVQSHERVACSVTQVMNCPGDELLSRSSLTINENGDITVGYLCDFFEYRKKSRVRAYNLTKSELLL